MWLIGAVNQLRDSKSNQIVYIYKYTSCILKNLGDCTFSKSGINTRISRKNFQWEMFLKMFRTYALNESAVIHNSSHAYCHIIFIYNIYHILART